MNGAVRPARDDDLPRLQDIERAAGRVFADLGMTLADVVDGCAHLEQVTVHPDAVTTFPDVPWNGPYHPRLGIAFLDPADLSPGLPRIREAEAARGPDSWPRAAMRLELRPRAQSG